MIKRIDNFLTSDQARWPKRQPFDEQLLKIALIALIMGTLLLMIDGLSTGFDFVQMLSLMLPPILWEHITFMGDTLVVLTLALLFAFRYPHLLLALLLTAIIGTLITHGIKPWLATPRPPGILEPGTFQLIGSSISKKSMPSGHTLTAFAAAGLLTRLTADRALQYLILIAACFVGWSRVAVGVHWPADVLMGAAGGLVSAWAGLKLCDRWQHRFRGWGYLTLLGIHGLCAIALLGYNGGMPHTGLFSLLTALICLGFSFYQLNLRGFAPKIHLFRR